jgi:ribose/xylose/arabinose/galactoside ABC-type transport system permease subunit
MADAAVVAQRAGEGGQSGPQSAAGPRRRRPDRREITRWLSVNGVYVALALVLLVDALFLERFLSVDNLRTQLVQVVPVVIVALGLALVIGTEGIDLSVGAVMALSAALLPLYLGYGWPTAVLVALLVGAACGVLNGTLVAVVGVQPIVATLALLVGGRGLALVLADGQAKQILDPGLLGFGSERLLGVPHTVVLAGVLVVLVSFLVRRTTFGRQLLAVGGNPHASRLAGLPVRRTLVGVYVLSGMLAAIAGVVVTARLNASDPSSTGLLIELAAITAVVVGGTPLSGGRVRVLGTVAGALLMQLLRATLNQFDVPDSTTQMISALVIVVAVGLQRSGRTS